MTDNPYLTHLDEKGVAHMVDVGSKPDTERVAIAAGTVYMKPATLALIQQGALKKGDVLSVARIAGIMAAKKTGELIPLCHPLGLENCKVNIHVNEQQELVIDCTASITAKTGVEMEALVGASIAALTVYDMCKALSHDIVIKETKLMEKKGGKSEFKRS